MLISSVLGIPFRAIFGGRSPVKLTIDYTATQFTFKWKAPSGSFLKFIDGDGTVTTTEGQDAVLLTHTTGYSGAGTYKFSIGGDVTDLTYIDISAQAFVSGDVSGWSKLVNLTYLNCRTTVVSGDVSAWSALTSLTQLHGYSTSISGDISSWSALTSLTYLKVDTSSVSGDISGLSALTSLTYCGIYSTSVTFDSAPAWSITSTILTTNNSMTSTMVDNMIASFSTCTGSTINIAGTNAHRTAASNDDLNTLLANGNTITLNDVLGAELHTSLNAANDNATVDVLEFADYAATIDGATKVRATGDIQNVNDCANHDYTTFTSGTPSGFDATSNGGAVHQANTADEINVINGRKYKVTFNLTLNDPGGDDDLPSFDIYGNVGPAAGAISDEGPQISASGANVFEFTSNTTGTGGLVFYNVSAATDYTIANLIVIEVGSSGEINVLDMIPQGAEEVTNGGFDADTDWSKGAGWAIGSGTLNGTATTDNAYQVNVLNGLQNKYIVVTYTVSGYSAGSVRIKVGDDGGTVRSANGTYTEVFRLTGSNGTVYIDGFTSFTGSIDNISVKELQVLGSDLVTNGSFTLGADLNVSNCVNGNYGTFSGASPSAFTAANAASGTRYASTPDEISFVSGQKYVVTFDLTISSGVAPFHTLTNALGGGGIADEGDVLAVSGANAFEFTANSTTTGTVFFYNSASIADYAITNLSVKDADTDWTTQDGGIIYGGTANWDGTQSAVSSTFQASILDAIGDIVLTKFTVSNYSAGTVKAFTGNTTFTTPQSANGTYSVISQVTGNTTFGVQGDSNFIGSIDNVSVHKLTWTKEVADSTNYTGDHYCLPIDENSLAIPVDYTAESIVAQLLGGETNATTGFTQVGLDAGANVFESQSTVTNTGAFALHADANDTPTTNAGFSSGITVDNGAVYRISWDWRHVGSGGLWTTQFEVDFPFQVDNTDTTFTSHVHYLTMANTTLNSLFKEFAGSNNGGIYMDNFSVKKVTFP